MTITDSFFRQLEGNIGRSKVIVLRITSILQLIVKDFYFSDL